MCLNNFDYYIAQNILIYTRVIHEIRPILQDGQSDVNTNIRKKCWRENCKENHWPMLQENNSKMSISYESDVKVHVYNRAVSHSDKISIELQDGNTVESYMRHKGRKVRSIKLRSGEAAALR